MILTRLRLLAYPISLIFLLAACAETDPDLATEEPEVTEDVEEDVVPEPEPGNGQVVVVSWGGEYQDAQRQAFWEPFERETGIQVIDAEQPEHARIIAQVDSGNPEWDVITTALSAFLELGPDYFTPIDYETYAEAYASIPDEAKREHSVVSATFCYSLAYREDAFPDGGPANWVEFWDAEQFPGPRGMALDAGVPWNSVEAAWFSAGNDSIDDIDLDVVFEQFDAIAPHIGQWWTSGAESLQHLATDEVVMSVIDSGSVFDLLDQGVPVALEWQDSFCGNDLWYILNGSPNEENAQRLIAYMMDPERQAEFANLFPMAVPNPEAYDYISPERARNLATHPDNVDRIILDEEGRGQFWADNREEVVERFTEWRLDRGQ